MLVVDGVEMVDVREAARLAGRTPETIRRWVWSGRLAATKNGNKLLVARRDLEASAHPEEAAPGSLAEWAAQLPTAPGGARTAAELVLDDRAGRDAGR
jgi:excisionase family DNA binding protein